MAQRPSGVINAWEVDPGSAKGPDGGALLHRDVPNTEAPPFATRIAASPTPRPDNYQPGTKAFRYWVCADALRRASDLWGAVLGNHKWNASVGGGVLPIKLDEGVDLNAYYNRIGLHFFHAAVGGRTVYSAESPDVVCHEHGHAVLDAIRPQLWDVASFEPPAFHESFGDMSAMLAALQIPSIRINVLQETNSEIYQSSRLSRLAEQLGWALRQKWPDQVDGDCLRNAVNSQFYRNPLRLPTTAPARQLSSEPHSFSRVFTAAFLETLALMFASSGDTSEVSLQHASLELARILVAAIAEAPVVPEYLAQVGAHMLVLATDKDPRYGEAVKTAMVKHGILSVLGVTRALSAPPVPQLSMHAIGIGGASPALATEELDASAYGLTVPTIHAVTAGEPKRYEIAGAAASIGDAEATGTREAALAFFEDLIRRGRLDYGGMAHARFAVMAPPSTAKTHRLAREGDRVVLRRIRIDCCLHKAHE